MVKVRLDGPSGRRWQPYARVWWEQNRGPIPPGKVVLHLDGDASNDEPSNLALGTLDDALFIAHHERPGRNTSALRVEALRETNRIRARTRRLVEWLPGRWYLVDHAERRIWNTGSRDRVDALAVVGIEIPERARSNGRGWVSAVLGWPSLLGQNAITLAVLLDQGGSLSSHAIRELGNAMLSRFDDTPEQPLATWSCAVSRLRRAGLVEPRRRGERSIVRISAAGRATRTRRTDLVAMRGHEVAQLVGYVRVTERGRDYQREVPLSERQAIDALLSAAVAS